ncbi:hypothetical protein FGG78_17525 [Thioclava sp. BHET1]|nr:hypothetical protein FGG78_17525 [Thioclava sp. BHET1]
MTLEERAQTNRDEEWDAFLADLEEKAAHTAQKGDKLKLKFYRPAPDIAPGFYFIPKEFNDTHWLPDLLARDCEPPESVVITDGLGGHFLLLKPEPLYQMVGNRYMEGYSTFLFGLGGGGYVNIYLDPGVAGVDNSWSIRAVAYKGLEAAFEALYRQAAVDCERLARNKMPDNAKAPDEDGGTSREMA